MKNLPATNFQVLTPHEFLEDVKIEAKEAKYRIWAQAMEVEPGEYTNQLLTTIEKKAEEGLDAKLHVDYYSLLVTNGAFNYLMYFNKKFAHKEKHRLIARKMFFERMEKNGVKLLYTNPPKLFEKIFPLKGRNHMKIVVIDNNAYIGGINFHDSNINGNDFMVKLTDPRIVSHIATLFKKVDRQEKFNDYKVTCTDDTTLLVDSGKIGKSIILDNALNLTQNAQSSVFMTTAFFPDTKMVRTLHALYMKGEEVKVVAPTPRSMNGIYMYVEKLNYEIMRFRKLKFPTKMIRSRHHAKVLIVDRKVAMFGSHNFSGRGVTMGTGEVAIMSTNRILIENLLEFFHSTYQKD